MTYSADVTIKQPPGRAHPFDEVYSDLTPEEIAELRDTVRVLGLHPASVVIECVRWGDEPRPVQLRLKGEDG